MNSRFLIFLIIIISLFEGGCNKQNTQLKENNIEGSWYCQLNDEMFSGEEKIHIENNSFNISDSLYFSGEDSEFKFSMIVFVKTGGEFQIRNDSIFLTYQEDRTSIIPQASSFKVDLTGAEEEKRTWNDTIKSKMRKDLEDYLLSSLGQQYGSLYNNQIFFGKIIMLNTDSVYLINNNTYLSLYKDPSLLRESNTRRHNNHGAG